MSITFHWMHRKNWPNTEQGLRDMAQTLEKNNVSSVLLPYGPTGVDFSVLLPDILKSTKKIHMMLAMSAYAVTPEYASKTFYTMDRYGTGRTDLNLVSGRYDKEREDFVIDHYPGDTSILDEHDKRVSLTEPWMEKFVKLRDSQPWKAKLCVVGSSNTTLRIADKYTDYIIIGDYQLNDNFLPKLTNTNPILLVDPLILEDGEDERDVQYVDYQYTLSPNHTIKGTHEEVVARLKEISTKFNINNFLLVTDQVDLSRIFRVIRELTQQP